jgi:hypothetical protein
VGSLLFIDWEIVAEIIRVYARAISDLIAAGRQIKLDLQFCKIFLEKKKVSCQFRKNFVHDLNNPTERN